MGFRVATRFWVQGSFKQILRKREYLETEGDVLNLL